MTKKLYSAALLPSVAFMAMALVSCHEDMNPWAGDSQGSIAPAVALNTDVLSARKASAQSRSGADVSVNDLSLVITSTDGTYSHTWTSVADFDPSTKFPVGGYKVEAVYGDVSKEGFECPAYYGSTDVAVRENETTQVSLTATLANAMVSVDYTDAFRKYMVEYDANLHSTGGQYIYYAQSEDRPAYIAPGEITMNVWFKKPGGQSATLQVAKFNAQARHHYHMTIDLNNGNGGGDAVLVIVFDESLDREDVRIELSDELMNMPAPTVEGVGDLKNGSAFTHIVGDSWSTPLKADIVAKGGIESVVLTTSSKSLTDQGWPAEIGLMKADAVMQARLKQLGFSCLGLWSNPGTMAVLDFTKLMEALKNDAAPNNFTVLVTDAMGKVSEPFSFAVNTSEMLLALSNPSTLAVGAKDLSFDLNYNGSDAKSVAFQYQNDRGTWTTLPVTAVTASDDATKYRVSVTVPSDSRNLTIRAISGSVTSQSMTVNRTAPSYSASVAEADVWANKATIALASDAVDASVLAASATVYVSTDGTNFTAKSATVAGNRLTLTGLNPGTAYTVRVSVTGNADQSCAPVSFTTEAALGVPNGDFEQLSQSLSESGMYQGGKWSISAGINYQSKVSYTISEPTGWASVNKKTTSGTTRNSWFVVPSTFNSSLSYSSTVPAIHVIGTGGGTETPDSYKGFTAHSGSNAMVIRNVAWDPAGSVPGVWKKEFAGSDEYYNHTTPTISQVSAGKLFLGSYSYSGGTESYNEGTSFVSRPAALSGWYTYTQDPNDPNEHGKVVVELLNGSTVIASGSAQLSAKSAYAQFNVPLTYVANAPKATSLRIMFTSSSHASTSQAAEAQAIKVSEFKQRYESAKHGATLVVDQLTFAY